MAIDIARSALLIVDLQNDFVHPQGAYGRAGLGVPAIAALPARLKPLAAPGNPQARRAAGARPRAGRIHALGLSHTGTVQRCSTEKDRKRGRNSRSHGLVLPGHALCSMPCHSRARCRGRKPVKVISFGALMSRESQRTLNALLDETSTL